MSSDNRGHVVPNKGGGWDIKKAHGNRASVHADTQAQAIIRAKEFVHNAGGGEVTIHGRDGKIRDSDTEAPGNDPNRHSTSGRALGAPEDAKGYGQQCWSRSCARKSSWGAQLRRAPMVIPASREP